MLREREVFFGKYKNKIYFYHRRCGLLFGKRIGIVIDWIPP